MAGGSSGNLSPHSPALPSRRKAMTPIAKGCPMQPTRLIDSLSSAAKAPAITELKVAVIRQNPTLYVWACVGACVFMCDFACVSECVCVCLCVCVCGAQAWAVHLTEKKHGCFHTPLMLCTKVSARVTLCVCVCVCQIRCTQCEQARQGYSEQCNSRAEISNLHHTSHIQPTPGS